MSGKYIVKLGRLRCCYTTRALGNFSFARGRREEVLANYRRLEQETGIAMDRIARAELDNGLRVARVVEADAGRGVIRAPGPLAKVDALYTDVPGLYIGFCTADCFPLTFYDRARQAVGMAHCGWRGIVGRLDRILLEAMAWDFGTQPRDVTAVIGPGIRRCCYRQHDDGLRNAFAGYRRLKLIDEHGDGQYSIDIALALRSNLAELGIAEVVDTGQCTGCSPEFFSARKEGYETGRMLNLAAVTA
ncbi:MAG: laccase domain-containing protein [Firmicutes bacterium]|nr:laccase domain-containing protein [Bacillota bacterium]HOB34698.1 polyphenol oxidase family protein [Bacillota bacterium]HPZ90264.1 polyphenol oxidase family protein [Bacillota bacterium]HQE01654.1 polyphenol oxidase family protein [Bacillota bacterium]